VATIVLGVIAVVGIAVGTMFRQRRDAKKRGERQRDTVTGESAPRCRPSSSPSPSEGDIVELLHLAQEKSDFWPAGAIILAVITVISVGLGILRLRKERKDGRRDLPPQA
jgi:hypothetical protein